MSVQAISSANTPQKQSPIKKHFNTVEITGYGALGTGIASGIAGAKKKIKLHRYLAYVSVGLAIAHTAIIEWNHHKYKKSK